MPDIYRKKQVPLEQFLRGHGIDERFVQETAYDPEHDASNELHSVDDHSLTDSIPLDLDKHRKHSSAEDRWDVASSGRSVPQNPFMTDLIHDYASGATFSCCVHRRNDGTDPGGE